MDAEDEDGLDDDEPWPWTTKSEFLTSLIKRKKSNLGMRLVESFFLGYIFFYKIVRNFNIRKLKREFYSWRNQPLTSIRFITRSSGSQVWDGWQALSRSKGWQYLNYGLKSWLNYYCFIFGIDIQGLVFSLKISLTHCLCAEKCQPRSTTILVIISNLWWYDFSSSLFCKWTHSLIWSSNILFLKDFGLWSSKTTLMRC